MNRSPIPAKAGWWLKVFESCAGNLHWFATKLDPFWPGGMDYVKINVILFCIILPVILLGLMVLVIVLW